MSNKPTESPQPCGLSYRSHNNLHCDLFLRQREERRKCHEVPRRASTFQARRFALGSSRGADAQQQATFFYYIKPFSASIAGGVTASLLSVPYLRCRFIFSHVLFLLFIIACIEICLSCLHGRLSMLAFLGVGDSYIPNSAVIVATHKATFCNTLLFSDHDSSSIRACEVQDVTSGN